MQKGSQNFRRIGHEIEFYFLKHTENRVNTETNVLVNIRLYIQVFDRGKCRGPDIRSRGNQAGNG